MLMNRSCVPDVPLEVYYFLNLHLHKVILIATFSYRKGTNLYLLVQNNKSFTATDWGSSFLLAGEGEWSPA